MTLLMISVLIFGMDLLFGSLVRVSLRNVTLLSWVSLLASAASTFFALKAAFSTPDPNVQAAGFTLALMITVVSVKSQFVPC